MKLICIILFFLIFFPCSSAYSETCSQCHTFEPILQILVKTPPEARVQGISPGLMTHAVKSDTYYKRYLIDKNIIKKDPHFENGCTSCHKGDGKSMEKETAHKGIVNRPSADLRVCGDCHEDIAKTFKTSLHYTVSGLLNKFSKRLSGNEEKLFKDKLFVQSCKSCHASCGDCHVSSPSTKGFRSGFIDGHRFVKKDEGKTCGVCHGERAYAEYLGVKGESPDVHFKNGMKCIDCHKKAQLHGDGNIYMNKDEVKNRPRCRDCHKSGKESKTIARLAHTKHEGKVSCYGCHVDGQYNHCYSCHIGEGSHIKKSYLLGLSPVDKKTLTTLRSVPVTRESLLKYGIKMEKFDDSPDYRAAYIHNIKRSTERTRSCDICHVERRGFLTEKSLIKDGSRANEGLILKMGPLNIN